MRVGILGGTFDPIHHGHLFLAEYARVSLDLDEVLLIPNGRASHKDNSLIASPEHRLAMVRLAAAGNQALSVSDIEAIRSGLSYTVETLRQLHQDRPGTDWTFLIGTDAARDLGSWYEPAEILDMARMVVAIRPGFPMDQVLEALPNTLRSRLTSLEGPFPEVSATGLRACVQAGLPIRYLVPDEVAQYVERNGLYRNYTVTPAGTPPVLGEPTNQST